MKQNDIMVDIESLSLSPRCAILQIGAVEFDPSGEGVIGEPFLVSVDRISYEVRENEFVIDDSTIKWWADQSAAARASLRKKVVAEIAVAMYNLTCFIKGTGFQRGNDHRSCIWAQGAQFDIVALQHAYEQCGMLVPWEYYQVRDSRTYIREAHRNFIPTEPLTLPENLVAHRADHDAIRQVFYTQEATRLYKNNDKTTAVPRTARTTGLSE